MKPEDLVGKKLEDLTYEQALEALKLLDEEIKRITRLHQEDLHRVIQYYVEANKQRSLIYRLKVWFQGFLDR